MSLEGVPGQVEGTRERVLEETVSKHSPGPRNVIELWGEGGAPGGAAGS